MDDKERHANARRFYSQMQPLEILFDVGESGNLIDRAMCFRYQIDRDVEEPYKSGALSNARSWRQRPKVFGGHGGKVYPTGQAALDDVGEDRLLYDLYAEGWS